MGPPLRLRLLAIVWYWFARPFTDVSFAYDEAEGRLHKALVAFFSPLLFLWHLFLQSPEVSPYTCLYDLPPITAYEMRLVAGEWVPFSRLFSFQDLAGEPVLIVNIATRCSEIDRNYGDLKKVQQDLEAKGINYIKILGFPCDQFLRQTPEGLADVCDFVQGRGATLTFFDKIKVNGRFASPIYNFLKQASGDLRPVEWNFAKFLVGPDGRTVRRYHPLVLYSDIVEDAYQMQVAGEDYDYLPSSFDNAQAVPVTGRWRRRLHPAANTNLVQAFVMTSGILALFLYPASVASAHPPKTAAVDGVLLASTLVLLGDTLIRSLATALSYAVASGGLYVGLFFAATMALDISFLAGNWAARQTGWRFLTAIRAARVSRVLRLYSVWQLWRSTTPNWTAQVRYPDPKNLARKIIDSATLKVYIVVVISATIAAPYLEYGGNLDQVASSMGAVAAVIEPLRPSPAGSSDPLAALIGWGGVGSAAADAWPQQAAVLCNVAAAAGVRALSITNVPLDATYFCGFPAGASSAALAGAFDHVSPLVVRPVGHLSVAFSMRDQVRSEGLATMYLIAFTIVVAAGLSALLSESVNREVVRPLEWVSSMLSMKTAEAYNTLKRVIAIDDTVETNMEPNERMIYQLSRLVLCFRKLAYSQLHDESMMDRYLAGEDGKIDQATRQWLLGQTGQMVNATAIESAGLQFVLARQSTAAAGRASSGVRAGSVAGPRVSANALTAMRAGQSSGRDEGSRLSQSGFLPFTVRSNRSEQGLGWEQEGSRDANGNGNGNAHPHPPKNRGSNFMSQMPQGAGHRPSHLERNSLQDDQPQRQRDGWDNRRSSLPSQPIPAPGTNLGSPGSTDRLAVSAPRQVRRELQQQHSSALSSVSILDGLAQAWNRSKRETGDRFASAASNPVALGGGGGPFGGERSVHGGPSVGAAHPNGSVRAGDSSHGHFNGSAVCLGNSGSDRQSGDGPALMGLPTAASLTAGGRSGGDLCEPWVGALPLKDPTDLLGWGVDLFEFGPMDLCRLAFAVFDHLGAVRNGYCSALTLWMFVVEVSNMYHANPFHNFRHAVDVLQTLAHFLKAVEARKLCSPLEMFVLCVAALAHDLDHPGCTNAFLINTSDPLALLYNDAAVLARAGPPLRGFCCLFATKPSVNVLSRCDKETLKGVRKLMLEVVLHTDMSKHFSMVSKAELFAELHMGTIAMAARGDANAAQRLWTKGEDRTFAMALLLHAADISNPAKPLEIQEKWAHKVMQEFFRQGDREAELGLPISPGFDRKTASLPSSQLNFIEFVVMPLYASVIGIFPELSVAMTHLQHNYTDYVERELSAASPKAEGGPDMSTLLKRRSAFNRKAEQGLANAARALAKHHGEHTAVNLDGEQGGPQPPGGRASKTVTPGRSIWSAAAAAGPQRMLSGNSRSTSRLAWKSPDGSDKEKQAAAAAQGKEAAHRVASEEIATAPEKPPH